jgi:hypothetical protein
MATVRYTHSIAALSWIDLRSGLPEVDPVAPAPEIRRSTIVGSSGYRFANFMEVWANYDTDRRSIVGHGFTNDSGIYTSPSYGGLPSQRFQTLQTVRVGREPITFTQITGARTQSPERIGGMFGPAGNIFGSAVSAFAPIWTKLEIRIFNDGRYEGRILQHSIFPSVSFYLQILEASGAPTGRYRRTAFSGADTYDGVPNLDRWEVEGWGSLRGGSSGPTAGNPWDYERSVFTGIDPTQPFGW